MSDPDSIINPIRRTLWVLVAATVVLYLALGVAGVLVYKEGKTTQTALCALRGDLEKRVATSKDFLRSHPTGIAGIPASTIRIGIENEQRTIDALSIVSC